LVLPAIRSITVAAPKRIPSRDSYGAVGGMLTNLLSHGVETEPLTVREQAYAALYKSFTSPKQL